MVPLTMSGPRTRSVTSSLKAPWQIVPEADSRKGPSMSCSLCTVEALEKHRKHAEEFREERKSIAFFIVSWDDVIDKIS